MKRFGLVLISSVAALVLAGCPAEETGETDPPNPPPPTDPAQLEPPAAGEGFQFESEEFEVASGSEVQDCYFFKVSELAKK